MLASQSEQLKERNEIGFRHRAQTADNIKVNNKTCVFHFIYIMYDNIGHCFGECNAFEFHML